MTPGQTRIRDLELLLVLNEEGNMTRSTKTSGRLLPSHSGKEPCLGDSV
jgi:hypothetical protein